METRDIATIRFQDHQNGQEALAIVRKVGENIALCLSLSENGDIEIFLEPAQCRELIAALGRAISHVP